MNAYIGLLSSMNANDIATEGKIGDMLKDLKKRVQGAISRIIEWLTKVAANIAAAVSKLPKTAAKADKNVRPLIQVVDKMVAIAIKSTKDTISGTTKGISGGSEEFDNTANAAWDAVEKYSQEANNISERLKDRAGTDNRLSAVGANAAAVGIKGWLGKLNLLQKQVDQINESYKSDGIDTSDKAIGVASKVITTTLSTIQNSAAALKTGCQKVITVDAEIVDDKNTSKGENNVSVTMQKSLPSGGDNTKALGGNNPKSVPGKNTNQKALAAGDVAKQSTRSFNKARNLVKNNIDKEKRDVVLQSLMETDTSLEYVVESLIAMIEYKTQGYYKPETDIGMAIEAEIEATVAMRELDNICID